MIKHQYPIPVNTLIKTISDELFKKYSDHALCTQYAWWVLQAITNYSKSQLLFQSHISLSSEQHEKLNTWITQQINDNIPLAYLLGTIPFASAEIIVEPPVLIPRQETEEWCLSLITNLKNAHCTQFTLLDLCTGSGCIAIALAQAFPLATIYALDISEHALRLAQKNAKHNHVSNIIFVHSDLFTTIPDLSVDIITANPPYIAQDEWQSLDQSVKQWEDRAALIAPDQGLGILKQIIHNAHEHLLHNPILTQHAIPQLWLEIGYAQGTQVQHLMQDAGFSHVRVTKDLHGNDRVVTGCLDDESAQ